MSLLTTLLRMRAAATGNALPTSRLRHLHLSDRPLMLLPLKQSGTAARPLAVMLGTDPARPELFLAPPTGSTTPMLTSLASRVTAYIEEHQRRHEHLPATSTRPARQRFLDAPQLLVPNPHAVAYLNTLGRDLRLRPVDGGSVDSCSVRRLGQWLTFFAGRAELPGTSALIPLTGFLAMHWVTGQSPLEDEDVATLLAWIDPSRHTASGHHPALAAEDPATHRSAGPATDPAFDTDYLAPLFHAYRAGPREQARCLNDLRILLAHYMQPTWERMWQAYTLLQALPEADGTRRRWKRERTEFTDMTAYLAQDRRPQRARDDAVAAAIGLARREHAAAAFAAERALDDPFTRAELRTTGEAFGGTVTTVDADHLVYGSSKRAQWRPRFTVSTTDPLRLEPGQILACHTHRDARYTVRAITPRDSDTFVDLEITAGMGTPARPRHTVLPDTGAFLVCTLAPDHYHRMPQFPLPDQIPWTHAGPPHPPPERQRAKAAPHSPPPSPHHQEDHAQRAIVEQLPTLTHPGLVVDAPPGAGKTTLVIHAAQTLAHHGAPCIVITQTNTQADDLVRRLAHSRLPTARLTAANHTVPPDMLALPGVRVGHRIESLKTAHVVVGTAMKWATVHDRRWPWAIIDEAYQMRSDALLRTGHLFDQALFVGDPGQLDPFSTIRTHRWVGLPHDPMNSAVAVLLAQNRDLPVHTLSTSWRLPPTAVPLIRDAFYTFTPFEAASHQTERTLTFTAMGRRTPVDKALETAARTGWALLELPARITHRIDAEAFHTALETAAGLLHRQTTASCDNHPQGRVLEPRDLAIGVAHRSQAHYINELLARHYPRLHGVTVDTANRLQGREFSVTIVLHPLSGRWDASAFHLEAGRLCVLASRHRHACIVITRAGIAPLLDAHPSNDPVHLGVTSKTPDGWEAHHAVLAHLAQHTVRT
ncbi:AAA family ATPase [Streptomyces sp. XD-27]|uniref:AAA family ATPase n=1 Tax=Streptomyces sp. XD-27 TaxID=3062779 RepID=UPI0026F47076|nr:AAA family ATPase [Streptomyces sp. XD-27]WKX68601.1 AAA family ATPase [Streptomyces sp. XD-27]